MCPFANCQKVLLGGTLPRHLVMVHNVAKGAEEQKKMLSLAQCHVEPPKDCQISSPRKEFRVNQKLCLKSTNLNTGEEKINVGNTDYQLQ